MAWFLRCRRGSGMTDFILTAIALYGAVVGGLYLFQRQLMYFPDRGEPNAVEAGVPEMEARRLATSDGLSLLAWYRAPASPAGPVLVFFHGNAGNIGDRGWKVRPFLEAGFGVLLVSYRGYGGNEGRPTEEGLYADGRAALDFLMEQKVRPERIVVYGESLGSAVAVQVASERRLGAVVLEAPFTSTADLAAHHYPWMPARWLVRDRFDSASKISGIGAPLLVLHGERDRTVPVRYGRRLLDAAAEPKEGRFYPHGGHNDLGDFGTAEAVIDFIRRHLPEPAEAG